MKTPDFLLPDLPTLTWRLNAALGGDGSSAPALTVVDRTPPRMMCTYPNEVVTYCRNGLERRAFNKYESRHGHGAYGHRGNVAYEAEVYRQVLQPCHGFRPRYLGAHTEPKSGETWLVLEYLNHCIRLCDMKVHRWRRQPTAMAHAARWIGRFHATHQVTAGDGAFPFLRHYDAEYLQGWARRTLVLARPLHHVFPWLEELCSHSEWWTAPLLSAPLTVVHGEFYPKNLLLRGEKVHVVDWESAAVAAGEIDLAALTEGGWPVSYVSRSERAYQHARWPEGTPPHFRPTLEAAHVYLHFRWLGERQDWSLAEKNRWRYSQLRLSAKKLGLL